MGLLVFLLVIVLLFAFITWFTGKIDPQKGSEFAWWSFGGTKKKSPPVHSQEAEAYSKKLLDERRKKK
jgi:hypothetical protein